MQPITIAGWFGHGNVGDEAYRLAFPKIFPGRPMTFTESPAAGPVVLGGGNVCSESFLNKVERVCGPKYAVSVGVSRNDPVERMKMFDRVFVRDRRSAALLAAAGVPAAVIPDAAFVLEADAARGRELVARMFKDAGRDRYERLVVVVLNSYLCVGHERLARDEATFHRVAWDIAKVADDTSASFLFLPFGQAQPHDDRIANAWVAGRCKFWKKNLVAMAEADPQTVLDLVAAADAAVTTRLHAAIFSTVAGRPFVDITHHSKNASFLEEIGREGWGIDYWDFNRHKFAGVLNDHLDRAGSDHGLGEITRTARRKLLALETHAAF